MNPRPVARCPDRDNETTKDIAAIARRLGDEFAKRAAAADEGDRFVSENYEALKASGLVEAGVPRELGGGGAEVAELADMLRTLGHSCSSTALAFPCTRIRSRFRPGAGATRRWRPSSHC